MTHLASGVPKAPGSAPSAPGAFVLSGGLQRIGYVHERTPGIWLWNVTVNIPGAPFGSASSLNEAKVHFKTVWRAFEMHGPEELAEAYREMNVRKKT